MQAGTHGFFLPPEGPGLFTLNLSERIDQQLPYSDVW